MLVRTVFHDHRQKSHGMALWQIVNLGQGFFFAPIKAYALRIKVMHYHADGVPVDNVRAHFFGYNYQSCLALAGTHVPWNHNASVFQF